MLDFIFSLPAFFRYRDSDECFLFPKPRTGNYGTWGIAGAILILCGIRSYLRTAGPP